MTPRDSMDDAGDPERGFFLFGLFRVLWKWRHLIFLGTVGSMLLGVVVVLLLPAQYQSRAIISLDLPRRMDADSKLKGMEIPTYQRFESIFQDPGLLRRYSKRQQFKAGWEFDDDFFQEHFQPRYAFEARRPGIKGMENSVTAIAVRAEDSTAQRARERARIMGNYIITLCRNLYAVDFIETRTRKSNARILEINDNILRQESDTESLREKEAFIINELLKLPGIANRTDRELVTASRETEKYLSPYQQLVAVKMSIKENQLRVRRYEQEFRFHGLILQYVSKTAHLFSRGDSHLVDEGLLDALQREGASLFAGQTDTEARQASNAIMGQLAQWQIRRDSAHNFINGPTLPERSQGPNRNRILIGVFFLALVCFTFIALLLEAWFRGKSAHIPPVVATDRSGELSPETE